EVVDRAVVLTLFLVSHAAIVEGPGVVGIEFDRLIVVLDGAVVLALCRVGVTAVVVGDDQGWRRLLARIDECGAPTNLNIRRRAIYTITQFNIPKLRVLSRALRPDLSPEQQQH